MKSVLDWTTDGRPTFPRDLSFDMRSLDVCGKMAFAVIISDIYEEINYTNDFRFCFLIRGEDNFPR